MAQKKDSTIMWFLAIAAAGGAIWYFSKKTSASPNNTPASPGLPPVDAVQPSLPSSGPIVSNPTPAPSLNSGTGSFFDPGMTSSTLVAQRPAVVSTSLSPGGLTDQQQMVRNAFEGDSSPGESAQFEATMSSYTPAEWAGLIDLYTGGFNNMTAERRAFWDMWRTKYHTHDGTY